MAADRQTGDLPDLLDPWQPALLQLIERCAAAGKESGKSVSVCGEAAADPMLAPILVGLGISRLSMASRSLPAVRAQLAQHDLHDCRRLSQRVLDAGDAAEARAAARADTTLS
jgi:phosphotransferase system enzyme I (PtsI)